MTSSVSLLFSLVAVFTAAACAKGAPDVPNGRLASGFQRVQTPPPAGAILGPGEGEFLSFCDTPHLDVTIKFSAPQHSSAMEMGTARLTPGTHNFGRHTVDEIIYFVSGSGFATVGERRTSVKAGSSMFVPATVRHGFENTGAAPMEFVWVTSPAGFAEGVRGAGKPSLADCASTPQR